MLSLSFDSLCGDFNCIANRETLFGCAPCGHTFLFYEREETKIEDFRRLYFHLFGRVADVIEEYDSMPTYEKIVKKLKQIELEIEDMYMDMPFEEDEVVEEDE